MKNVNIVEKNTYGLNNSVNAEKMIKFKQLPIGDEEKEAINKVLDSGSLSMGKAVGDFEYDFAKFIGSKHAIAVNSCTSAIFLSLHCENKILYGYPMADNETAIRLPSMTVPVVANAIIHSQASLRFIDDISWIGKDYELRPFNVWDSAHLVYPDQYKKYNNPRALVCFSFYPTKTICGAEGGMIAVDDDEMAEWLRKARWYGRNDGSSNIRNSWEYRVEFPGWKMNMTDIQAAIAHCGLKKYHENDKQISRVIHKYNQAFGLKNSSKYLYRINVSRRDRFISRMLSIGIEVGVHFHPLHWQLAYSRIPRDEMIRTEKEAVTTVSLPLHPFLTDEDVDKIINAVKDWRTLEEEANV